MVTGHVHPESRKALEIYQSIGKNIIFLPAPYFDDFDTTP